MYSVAPISTPRAGCAATSTDGLRDSLVGQNKLLDVAARQAARGRIDRRRADGKLLHQLARGRRDRPKIQKEAVGVGRPHVAVQHHVFGYAKSCTIPSCMRSSGTYPSAAAVRCPGVHCVMSWPAISTWPLVTGRSPAITSASSFWPLPLTPATSQNLAGSYFQCYVMQRLLPCHPQRTYAARANCTPPSVAGCRVRSSNTSVYHHARQLGPCYPLVEHTAVIAPCPQHGNAVADRQHLAELMADKHKAVAILRHVAQRDKEVVHFLGVSTAVGSSRIKMSAPR